MKVSLTKNGVTLTAYQGDAMTLLAFDLDKTKTANFAGFSIKVTQLGQKPYFLNNMLCFPQNITYQPAGVTVYAISTEFSPIQKFRWVHVPNTSHNVGSAPAYGNCIYEVSARYLAGNVLQAIDPALTVTVTIPVCPFKSKDLEIGFTRSFIASQAFVHNFGNTVTLRPRQNPGLNQLIFNTKLNAGTVVKKINGVDTQVPYSYDDVHEYLGWQARQRVFDFLEEVLKDPAISLDVFAFDLDEPVICDNLLTLADQNRIRVLLDDSSTHVGQMSGGQPQFEDQFETQFTARATGKTNAKIMRGHFQALAHSKVMIQKKDGKAIKVLTGSTNFSTNGLYVNANNVLIFSNANVATLYQNFFEASFSKTGMAGFKNSAWAGKNFCFNRSGHPDNIDDAGLPNMIIRCSPHTGSYATTELGGLGEQVLEAKDNVLFAIMDDKSGSALLEAVLKQVQSNTIFTYGITDTSTLVLVYKPNSTTGIHVTGKGLQPKLPPPFSSEPGIPGISIHHKFVVVDFNTPNGVVFCGSSNLAFGPEQHNGDNLLEIRDVDVVTVFAIEAIRLVDHFQFRDRANTASANQAPLELHTDDKWVAAYYNETDLLYKERTLLARH